MSYGIIQPCPETGDDKVGFLSFRFFLVRKMILQPHKTPCTYHFELFERYCVDQKSFIIPFSLLLNALKVEVIANEIDKRRRVRTARTCKFFLLFSFLTFHVNKIQVENLMNLKGKSVMYQK